MSQSVQLSRLLCRNLLAGRSWRGRLSAVSAAVKWLSGLKELEKFCGFMKFVTEAVQVLRKMSEFLKKSWKIHGNWKFLLKHKAIKDNSWNFRIFVKTQKDFHENSRIWKYFLDDKTAKKIHRKFMELFSNNKGIPRILEAFYGNRNIFP